jgi:formate C-acetyltransferase
MDEMLEALRSNFEGNERMRQYLINRVAKWGNNDEQADALAKRIADYYCAKVHTFVNGRGGPCMAALFSLTFALQGGLRTGALPDGRKAHESLAPGLAATYGRDRRSATALIDSVCKLDAAEMPNGAVLDVNLHPSAIKGDDGLEALVALIKAFMNQGGYAVQFNVFDTETLRKAQRYPERYANLQVRVTGWSVYFNALTPLEQEQYIARITHGN